MATFKPFRAVRPLPEYAGKVAALPYDVMDSDEARQAVQGNPYSFLHVDKAEIDLPEGTGLYDEAVYLKARENLDRLESDGICRADGVPCFYVYRQIMDGRAQTGVVGCAAVDDYLNGVIKRHELTRRDKELDRINHVDRCDANTGPIFLAYRSQKSIHAIIEKYVSGAPVCDFTSGGVRNTVWVISDGNDVAAMEQAFDSVPALYIADGHHRAASAVHVGEKRRQQHPDYDGTEEFNFFLAVAFDSSDLAIMDYNRVLRDTNGLTDEELINRLSADFIVEATGAEPYRPQERHEFGMYLNGVWYRVKAKGQICDESDPVARLDVSVLQDRVIAPVFGITDPRTDSRIDFIGGIRGLRELERRCKADMKVAFSMYPTSLDELMAIADAGLLMPPKSTWFEPKLLSGLFIHKLS